MTTTTITTTRAGHCKVAKVAVDVTTSPADPMVTLATPCCGASGKGSMIGDEPAVVCRACYRPVSDIFGEVAIISGGMLAEAYSLIERGVTEAGCPCPTECVMHLLAEVEAATA